MVDRFLLLLLLSLTCLLAACAEDPALPLIGSWQAVAVTENGDSLRLDPAQVGFDFTADRRYRFRSTLKYTEAGTWRYDRGFLLANDTTRADSPERVVEIEKLNQDSLGIRMMNGSAERRMLLLRQ